MAVETQQKKGEKVTPIRCPKAEMAHSSRDTVPPRTGAPYRNVGIKKLESMNPAHRWCCLLVKMSESSPWL